MDLWTYAAAVVLGLAGAYAMVGLAFAGVFLTRGVAVVDHAAAGSRWTFRLLILPGVVALWPLMGTKWARARRDRRSEHRS
jgi:hypothetical protein